MTTSPSPHHTPEEWEFLRLMGKRIRLARVDRELSQEQLAARAGMSRNFVSSIERGAHGVDVLRLRRLAEALGVDIAALLPSDEGQAGVAAPQPVQRIA
jgi:transcriptional regulator with XRE-family HTH domain